MLLYYGLLVIATALFASQFLFNQKYQQQCGTAFSATLSFSIYTNAAAAVIMILMNGFHLEWSWFSFGMACIGTVTGIIYTYASMKAFSIVNLAMYSMFAMLGGMLLPFLYGIIFGNEEVTAAKVVCVILIVAALSLSVWGERDILKGWPYYLMVFVINGLSGVFASIHQSNPNAVDSGSYSLWCRIVPFVVCIILQLITEKKVVLLPLRTMPFTVGYAAFNGIGNLLLLIALLHVPASVQYPIVTGGTMVFSALFSALRKEKLTVQTIVATVIALISTILIVL